MEIGDIKRQLSIQVVLSHYNIKVDKNQMTNCPFHDDKTPSLQIYPKSNTYYCFSSNCSAGTGDQIQFIELMEKQGKHQAILKAKELLGVPTTTLNDLFEKLKQNINKSPKAKQHLQTRNLNPVKLEIGYNANTYKSLKNCIVFPLKNVNGNITSLYGRSVTDNGSSRHYYTSNRKGLYPKHPNKETRKLILTESVIDAATLLQQEGLKPGSRKDGTGYAILALYGTNGLTQEHKTAIQNLPHLKEVVFWMDGDGAGNKAVEKYEQQIKELLNNK